MATTSKVFKEDMREFNKSVKDKCMTTELIKELVGLAVEKNWNFDGCIDVKFIGVFNHVSAEIRFDNGNEFKAMINLDNSDAPAQLLAAIDKVKAL